jgi:uncharacterized membrane protein YsdA (DUF1294 family)
MEYIMTGLIIYLAGINIAAFISMGADKRRAEMHQWRIRESTLFLLAILGGSVGALTGMLVFHHKTKHLKFMIGMPAILIAQAVIAAVIYSQWIK